MVGLLGLLALVERLVMTKVVSSGNAPPATLGAKATPALQETPASLEIEGEMVLLPYALSMSFPSGYMHM